MIEQAQIIQSKFSMNTQLTMTILNTQEKERPFSLSLSLEELTVQGPMFTVWGSDTIFRRNFCSSSKLMEFNFRYYN